MTQKLEVYYTKIYLNIGPGWIREMNVPEFNFTRRTLFGSLPGFGETINFWNPN
jgi:hypothetical protein